jgi:hypothetical protein
VTCGDSGDKRTGALAGRAMSWQADESLGGGDQTVSVATPMQEVHPIRLTRALAEMLARVAFCPPSIGRLRPSRRRPINTLTQGATKLAVYDLIRRQARRSALALASFAASPGSGRSSPCW